MVYVLPAPSRRCAVGLDGGAGHLSGRLADRSPATLQHVRARGTERSWRLPPRRQGVMSHTSPSQFAIDSSGRPPGTHSRSAMCLDRELVGTRPRREQHHTRSPRLEGCTCGSQVVSGGRTVAEGGLNAHTFRALSSIVRSAGTGRHSDGGAGGRTCPRLSVCQDTHMVPIYAGLQAWRNVLHSTPVMTDRSTACINRAQSPLAGSHGQADDCGHRTSKISAWEHSSPQMRSKSNRFLRAFRASLTTMIPGSDSWTSTTEPSSFAKRGRTRHTTRMLPRISCTTSFSRWEQRTKR